MTLPRWGKLLVYQAENTKVKADYRQGNLVAKTQNANSCHSEPSATPREEPAVGLEGCNGRPRHADPPLPRSFLQQSLLDLLLALDAVPRPGHSLEALGIDFLAAMDALAEAAFANPRQRPLHHLQQCPLVIALAEKKLFGVGTGSAVGNVLRRIFVRRAPIRLGAGDCAPQILLPRLEPLFKSF